MKDSFWNKLMMMEATVIINHSKGCQAHIEHIDSIGIIKGFYQIQGLTKVKVQILKSNTLDVNSPFNDTIRHFDMHEIRELHSSMFTTIYQVTL